MKRLKVGIIDFVTNTPHEVWFQRQVMGPGFAALMPQCVGAWAEELGCEVFYETFTGGEDLLRCVPEDIDVLFLSFFSRASYLAYGVSRYFRAKGVVTVAGGPHVRSFTEHARAFFDYVCHFTDRDTIRTILTERARNEPAVVMAAKGQPKALPGVRARARFIDVNIQKGTWLFRVVPVIGSLGCPYTCHFCVDATVPYEPLPFEGVVDDLRYSQERWGPKVLIGWHDPNFGIRFKEAMAAVEASGTSLMHVAESSLTILKEENLPALKKNGFVAMLPGIESWYDFGGKGRAKGATGEDKLARVSAHLRQILEYIPYVQTNFVLGLDGETDEAVELTCRFIDEVPGAFPGYSLVSDFGNSPLSARLQREGRTLPVPYPLLDNNFAINVRLEPNDPIGYYDRVIRVMEHSWSPRALWRRVMANRHPIAKIINLLRGFDEGRGRLRHYRRTRARLQEDTSFLAFHKGEKVLPPQFFFDAVRKQLGPYAELLPPELLTPEGFVRSTEPVRVGPQIIPEVKERSLPALG